MTVFVGTDTARTRRSLTVGDASYAYYSIAAAEAAGLGDFGRLPASLKVVLENMLRFEDGRTVTVEDIRAFSEWAKQGGRNPREIAYRPARVLMQDFTGVPAVVDLAAMRDGDQGARRRPAEDQPAEPGRPRDRPFGDGRRVRHAARVPAQRRPRVRAQHRALPVPEVGAERLRQLPGGAAGHRHLPPGQPRVPGADGLDRQGPVGGAGRLSRHAGRHRQPHDDGERPRGARLGRRRHRGRGGDARAAGVDADPRGGRLQADRPDGRGHDGDRPGAQGDVQMLRKKGVVGKFVEFYGDGLDHLPLADRATIGNMAPEYGATCGFFPIDGETLRYLRQTGRDEARIALVEAYAKENGMWRGPDYDPVYTDTLHLDMAEIVPAIAGPKRPQDYTPLNLAARGLLPDGRRLSRHRRLGRGARRWAPRAAVAVGAARRAQDRGGRGRGLHDPRRLGGDRGDHLLHQHLEPLRDDRRRPRRAQGAGARAAPASPG